PFAVCDMSQSLTATNIVVNTNPPPSTNIMITNYYCTRVGFTNLVPTANPGRDYFPPFSGTLTFDDYQMSQDIFPVFVPARPFPIPRQRKEVNKVLILQLSNPLLDPQEN